MCDPLIVIASEQNSQHTSKQQTNKPALFTTIQCNYPVNKRKNAIRGREKVTVLQVIKMRESNITEADWLTFRVGE